MPQGPQLPEHGARIWNTFLQLHNARPSGGMGPGPITWGEIHAFTQVTGLKIPAWEAEAIRALDEAYFAARAAAPPPPPPSAPQEI